MNTTGGGSVMGSFPYPRNGILKLDYEFILIFKKQGRAPAPEQTAKKDSALTNEEWESVFLRSLELPGSSARQAFGDVPRRTTSAI